MGPGKTLLHSATRAATIGKVLLVAMMAAATLLNVNVVEAAPDKVLYLTYDDGPSASSTPRRDPGRPACGSLLTGARG